MLTDINKQIPEQLLFFLNEIIGKDKNKDNIRIYKDKSTSIAHAVVSAARPRSFISPLQLSLSTTLYREGVPVNVINICHNLGFSCSYYETMLYEASVIYQEKISLKPCTFIQMVEDNADFNKATVDGHGTFHNLGTIQIITPSSNILPRKPVERLKKIPPVSELLAIENIAISPYNQAPNQGLQNIHVKFSADNLLLTPSYCANLSVLWMYVKYMKNNDFIGWNGFMGSRCV